MKYQPREGCDPPKHRPEERAFPHHIDVVGEVGLPGHIHRTFARDLVGDVDAISCRRIPRVGIHLSIVRLGSASEQAPSRPSRRRAGSHLQLSTLMSLPAERATLAIHTFDEKRHPRDGRSQRRGLRAKRLLIYRCQPPKEGRGAKEVTHDDQGQGASGRRARAL